MLDHRVLISMAPYETEWFHTAFGGGPWLICHGVELNMRKFLVAITGLAIMGFSCVTGSSAMADALQSTREEAVQHVLSSGYARVLKADATQRGWELWAWKNGQTFEVQIDRDSGKMVEIAVDDND